MDTETDLVQYFQKGRGNDLWQLWKFDPIQWGKGRGSGETKNKKKTPEPIVEGIQPSLHKQSTIVTCRDLVQTRVKLAKVAALTYPSRALSCPWALTGLFAILCGLNLRLAVQQRSHTTTAGTINLCHNSHGGFR